MLRRDARPDEGLIHAWLDGELGAEEAARVERLVAEDAEWGAATAEARGLVAASTRILGALDVVAGDVIPRVPTVQVRQQVRRWRVPTWLKVAAGFVFVAGVGYLGLDRTETMTAPVEEELVAPTVASAAAPVAESLADQPVATTVTVNASPSPARSVRQSATAKQSAADLSSRADADVASSVVAAVAVPAVAVPAAAPAPSALQPAPTLAPGAAVVTGVAGGIASGAASRIAAEQKEMLAAAAGSADSKARMKSLSLSGTAAASARPERILDSPNSVSEVTMDRVADTAGGRTIVAGCWRTQTTARVDSVQTTLRIVRTAGDTLVLALTPGGAEARVLRESVDVLRGRARDASGTFVAFVATRTVCAP